MNIRQLLTLMGCLFLVSAIVLALWWTNWGEIEECDLTLATGPDNGAFLSIGQGISEVMGDPQITIHTQVSDGSVANMTLLQTRAADLAIVHNDTEPLGDIRTLIPLHRGVCHFLVPRDAEAGEEIASIYDLRPVNGRLRRVAVGSRRSGNWHVVHELLEHFGIEDDEFSPVYIGIADCKAAFENKEIDAALIITSISSPSLKRLVSGGQLRYVPLGIASEGNEVDGFAVTYPYVDRFTIPRYVYPVQDGLGLPESPTQSFALRSALVCRSDLPDAVARSIVESIVANRAKIMRSHHAAQDINEEFAQSDLQFPLHDGAVAYYQRQRPSFIERYSEPMALLLSLFLALCGMVAAFNQWLTLRKKNRIDRYYERLDSLLEELNDHAATRDRLDSIEQELLAMRHDAVRELVNERLLADESFQIFQSLLTDCHQQLAIQREQT